MLRLPYREFHNAIVQKKIQEAKLFPERSKSTLVTGETRLDNTEDWAPKTEMVEVILE